MYCLREEQEQFLLIDVGRLYLYRKTIYACRSCVCLNPGPFRRRVLAWCVWTRGPESLGPRVLADWSTCPTGLSVMIGRSWLPQAATAQCHGQGHDNQPSRSWRQLSRPPSAGKINSPGVSHHDPDVSHHRIYNPNPENKP